jgi:Na+-transporting NADH:ubiquinone oxidoreductase subunit NqrB
MAVRVKSTATVSAMLVMISSGLIVGVAELHAESNKVILNPSNRRRPIIFLFFISTPKRTK